MPCSNLFLTYTPASSLLHDSHHPWHLYSRKLIIVSSTQAPFYRPNCIGFLILNSFVLPNLAFSMLAYVSPLNLVSMPIEVASSPSITDTLDSYNEYSYQPSLFAKISSTGPANNWLIQEQAIAMEDSAADVSFHRCLQGAFFSSCFGLMVLGKNSCHLSLFVPHQRRNHQINAVYSNQTVPQGLSSFQPPPFFPRSSSLDKNASPDHSMSSDSSLSAGMSDYIFQEASLTTF